MKEVSLKRLQTHDISERQNYRDDKKISLPVKRGVAVGEANKGNIGEFKKKL